jgi:hypothetical protein
MDRLPNELLIYLCSWIPKSDLKSFRCCNNVLADAGQNELFRDFEFRLYPSVHRLYQLGALAANPIAAKLRTLSFESGILLEYADFRYWQAQIYEERTRLKYGTWPDSNSQEYKDFHAGLQARFGPGMQQQYNLYRWHLDQEAEFVAKQCSFQQMLRNMNDLAHHCTSVVIKISMAEPKVSLEDVECFDSTLYQHERPEDPDPRRRVSNRRHHLLDHFTNFLTAVHRSNLRVQNMVMLDVPRQLLNGNTTFVAETLPEMFAGLRCLDLRISSFPWSDWLSRSGMDPVYLNGRDPFAQRLRKLLDCATQLDSLRLEFPRGKEAEYSFDIFDRTNLNRFPRKFLPSIQHLELHRFRCSWEDLEALLQEASQLRTLTLANCRLETCSMVDLIQALPALKLERVFILGEWSVDEDGGVWHSHLEDDFASCNAATSFEGPYLSNGLKSRVDEFVVKSGASCPLPRWSSDEDVTRAWELMGDTTWHFIKDDRR